MLKIVSLASIHTAHILNIQVHMQSVHIFDVLLCENKIRYRWEREELDGEIIERAQGGWEMSFQFRAAVGE